MWKKLFETMACLLSTCPRPFLRSNSFSFAYFQILVVLSSAVLPTKLRHHMRPRVTLILLSSFSNLSASKLYFCFFFSYSCIPNLLVFPPHFHPQSLVLGFYNFLDIISDTCGEKKFGRPVVIFNSFRYLS